MDLVVFRGSGGFWGIFRGSGGFFVDLSSKWWFFRGLVVEMVVCSLIFRGNGVFVR